MQKIGTVAFVQIQRYSMKKLVSDDKQYDTNPLEQVEKLWLTGQGILGVTTNQSVMVDVHNETHPGSRYRGDNRISLGFLPNYEAMRARFGPHLVDGIAGENILIEPETTLSADILSKQWILGLADGTHVPLQEVIPAPPCREFSIFCAQETIAGAELKEVLQFLGDGRRGYYAALAQADLTCYVQAGDSLYVA